MKKQACPNSDVRRLTVAPSRRRFLRSGVTLGAAALMLLSGCGQKGPLFLPEDDMKKKKKKS